MQFGVLGPLEVRSAGGELVTVGGPRPRSLLAVLLLDAGRVVGVDRLIDGLYRADPPGDAANALQSQVSRLRRALGGLIEGHPAGYRLAVDPATVDVHRFTALAASGRRALASGDHAGAEAALREAVGLWRGPALADVADAPFAAAQVVRLEELRAGCVEDLAEAALGLGSPDGVKAELRSLLVAHPLRERARGQLMRALYGAGRQAEALTVFEDGRRRLAEELGADPSPELAEVHQTILRGEASPGRRLPAQLTSFVGREGDLARVADLLGSARLVTLLGPGGAGKTRLAIEAAGRLPDDASFVDLSAAGAVAQAVMGALGLRESGLLPSSAGPPDPVNRLIAALTESPPLLILDNCEHVVAEVADLAHRLLTACPALRVLATRREPLGITGESLHPLAPLEVESSVRLFADRAAAVRPGFTVTGGGTAGLRGPRRAAAGHRARRGPPAHVDHSRGRVPVGRPVSIAVQGFPRRARPASDAARGGGVELGSCSTRTSSGWPGGSRCSTAGPRSSRPWRCAEGPRTCLPAWWTSRWSSWTPAATGCWTPSGRSAVSGSPRPASTSGSGSRIRSTSFPLAGTRIRNCAWPSS